MFTKDNRTESFLTQMGVDFRYSNDLKLTSLPKGWVDVNRGRPVAVRESAVLEYASLMESGSPAPAVIVHDDPVTVLDGVQRLSAAQLAGFTRFSAYVVKCDSEDMLLAIRVLANARLQGHAEQPEWTKRNAVQLLVIDRGLSAAEVAKMGGWTTADIERLATVLDWGFQIRCIGGPEKLPDGIVKQIADRTTQEELRRASAPIATFLKAVSTARLTTQDAEQYVDEFFRRAPKVSTYQTRLEQFLETPEIDTRLHGRRSPGLSVDVNLRRTLRAAITILDEAIQDGNRLLYVDEFFGLAKDITSRLHAMAPHCKAADQPPTPADKWT